MQEFKVNEYLSLKLEDEVTNIYIKDFLFRQCMVILIDISVKKIITLNEIEFIDEGAEKLNKTIENIEHRQIPKLEFSII